MPASRAWASAVSAYSSCGRVSIAVECEQAVERQSVSRQRVIEILSAGSQSISMATPRAGGRCKDGVPVRDHTGTRARDAAARMREDPHGRLLDGPD
jgi:hypothetical protein